MEIGTLAVIRAREAIARDAARLRVQRRGALIIVGGVLIAGGAWGALTNGVLLIVMSEELMVGVALSVIGWVAAASAVVVIVLGARMRKHGWANGGEPASPFGKVDAGFDAVPSKYALPTPYLNHGGSGVR